MMTLDELIAAAVAAKAQREAAAEAEAEAARAERQRARRDAFIGALRKELPNIADVVNVETVAFDAANNPYMPFVGREEVVNLYRDSAAWIVRSSGRTIQEHHASTRLEEAILLAIGGY
jgi:multidrug efflux pump subunit AcrA (membrane-fusion protein)